MNIIDIIALVVIAVGVLRGYRHGLSGELAHVISVVVVFMLGLHFYGPLGVWLNEHSQVGEQAAHALAFVATLVAAGVAMILLRAVLKRIMRVVIADGADKLGGAVAGSLRAAVFVVIVFVLVNLWPHDYLNRAFGKQSMIGSCVLACMPELRETWNEVVPEEANVTPDEE